jgi:Protein of unknown function (DUF2889)
VKADLAPPPRRSAGVAPLRPPGSIRRTSSIDVSWPDGRGGDLTLVGRARDMVTPRGGGAPIVCAEDGFEARIRADRTILAIEADPPRPALASLVGQRGGGKLRLVLEEVVPEERRGGTPLYLILDDISGVSLVAGWAWSQWDPDWLAQLRAAAENPEMIKAFGDRAGICTGFAPGSSAFDPDTERGGATPAPDLRNPEDPEGWHAFTVQDGVPAMRRARRIDLGLDPDGAPNGAPKGEIVIDAAFQDSATTPQGGRAVVHEYRLTARADAASLKLLSIDAEPRVLPFSECPGAVANLQRLNGTALPDLRDKVLAELRGTAGCTHLNDAARALADAPALLGRLRDSGVF